MNWFQRTKVYSMFWVAATIVILVPYNTFCFEVKPLPKRVSSFSFHRFSSIDDCDSDSSLSFELDPESQLAQSIVMDHLALTNEQASQLKELASLVVEWNEKINLISRKDCSMEVVYGRHILPCLAVLKAVDLDPTDKRIRICDVGTGGGFPGMPLAIANPHADFVLVDSVGKKLKAVDAMIDSLGLTNVRTHHGRAEELDAHDFDFCTGRSVASLDKFCGWMHHLLRKESGELVYIIGGEVEEANLSDKIASINDLLSPPNTSGNIISDKNVMVFSQEAVSSIARKSNVKMTKNQRQAPSSKPKRSKKAAKGAWKKREGPAQRGYEEFKRYQA